MFTLNKEDRQIKKIVKKDKTIKLSKEDLQDLKHFITNYHIKNEHRIRQIASLSKEDRIYLEQLIKEYLPKIKEIGTKYPDRDCMDDFIGKAGAIIANGEYREKEGTGYKLNSNDMEYIVDIVDILSANSLNVSLSEELGEKLANLNEDGKYAIFMHRPHAIAKEALDDYIMSVFSRGLVNDGDGGATYNNGSNKLDKTFLTCQSKAQLINYAKASCDACYKGDGNIENNRGVVIAKIPKVVLEEGRNIWYKPSKDTTIHILHPSYIDGFLNFECNDEGKTITSYTENTYIVPDIETTANDTSNIYYTGSVKNSARRR